MRNLIPILFAPIMLAALSLGSTQGGDTGIGTLPVTRSGVTDCVTTSVSADEMPTVLVVRRVLAGAPGTTITAQRGGIMLVATSGEWGGTQEAIAPPTVVTSSWTSGGIQFSVTITQGPNESIPDFTRRVDATVRSLQCVRPRDGAATGGVGNQP